MSPVVALLVSAVITLPQVLVALWPGLDYCPRCGGSCRRPTREERMQAASVADAKAFLERPELLDEQLTMSVREAVYSQAQEQVRLACLSSDPDAVELAISGARAAQRRGELP